MTYRGVLIRKLGASRKQLARLIRGLINHPPRRRRPLRPRPWVQSLAQRLQGSNAVTSTLSSIYGNCTCGPKMASVSLNVYPKAVTSTLKSLSAKLIDALVQYSRQGGVTDRCTPAAIGVIVASTVATDAQLHETSRQAGTSILPGSHPKSGQRAGSCDFAAFKRLARVLGLRVRSCMAPSAPARGGPTKPTRGRRQHRSEARQDLQVGCSRHGALGLCARALLLCPHLLITG